MAYLPALQKRDYVNLGTKIGYCPIGSLMKIDDEKKFSGTSDLL